MDRRFASRYEVGISMDMKLLKAVWVGNVLFTEPVTDPRKIYVIAPAWEKKMEQIILATGFKRQEGWTVAEIKRFFDEAEAFSKNL